MVRNDINKININASTFIKMNNMHDTMPHKKL